MTDKKTGILWFCLLTAIFAFLLLFVSFMDEVLSLEGFLTDIAKAVLLAGILVFLVKTRTGSTFSHEKCPPRFFLLALIPAVFTAAGTMCRFDRIPGRAELLSGVMNVVLTALWEEFFFRGIGSWVFSGEGKLSLKRAMLLTLIFSLAHGVNILGGPPRAVLFQMLLAFCAGFLFLGLFERAGLFIAVLSHLFTNLTAETVLLFASEEAQAEPFMKGAALPLFAAQCTVTLLLGLRLIGKRPEGGSEGELPYHG